jgi:large subunit ribosomal protein L18
MRTIKRRRQEKKTDYKLRIGLLKSEKGRILFRKTNKYVIGQCIKSDNAQDKVVVGVTSKNLVKYGWPKEKAGSLKSLPACYLTGYLLGKKVLKKSKSKEYIFDLGMLRHIKKSRSYAFLKGVIDTGLNIKFQKDVFPDEKRLAGENTQVKELLNKIKEKIEKE